jgi:hypothetical protein
VGGAAIASGALAAALFVSIGARTKRGKARVLATARGVRRGAMVGSVIGLIALLRVLDGLTPLTGMFVIAPFIAAEAVLSARRA